VIAFTKDQERCANVELVGILAAASIPTASPCSSRLDKKDFRGLEGQREGAFDSSRSRQYRGREVYCRPLPRLGRASSREDAVESKEDDTRDRAVPIVACRPQQAGSCRSALDGRIRRGELRGGQMKRCRMSNVECERWPLGWS